MEAVNFSVSIWQIIDALMFIICLLLCTKAIGDDEGWSRQAQSAGAAFFAALAMLFAMLMFV